MKNTNNHTQSHGSILSYSIGFILSLIFTIIPYYLVVNNSFSSSALTYIILGFALLQMLIQIFFFLHLGRGPKPFYNVVFFVSTVFLIVVVVSGSVFIMDNLYRNMTPSEVTTRLAEDEGISQVGGEKTGACQGLKHNHKVYIKDGVVNPKTTEAKLCDTITFVNEDDKLREITFGAHPEHGSYGGEYEVVLRSSRPKSIVLNEFGYYIYHDHFEPSVSGSFIVSEQ
ncbi:MAG: cytochrome C oxidase subunit IV family protein [bacterium]|nr:cytochrome C oxidase subunit IV family protein [bacterium]